MFHVNQSAGRQLSDVSRESLSVRRLALARLSAPPHWYLTFHVKHGERIKLLLADAEAAKDGAQNFLGVDPPCDTPQGVGGVTELFGSKLGGKIGSCPKA